MSAIHSAAILVCVTKTEPWRPNYELKGGLLRAQVRRLMGMRHFGFTLFAILASAFANSPAATRAADGVTASSATAGCTLRIHVDGLRNSKGNLGTVLFKSATGWPEDMKKAFRDGPAPIDQGAKAGTAVWKNLPPGDYGVAAIHDENSNGRLDRNVLGIPKEGFGFANNPHVGLSAPRFQAAIVHVTCPVTDTTIHLQHK